MKLTDLMVRVAALDVLKAAAAREAGVSPSEITPKDVSDFVRAVEARFVALAPLLSRPGRKI
jgi:hypothetical protein